MLRRTDLGASALDCAKGWFRSLIAAVATLTARHRRVVLALLALGMAAGLGGKAVASHIRAARFLSQLASVNAASPDVSAEELTLAAEGRPVRARLYRPPGAMPASGLVLLHGVHRLGIEEPRLQRFSRAFASLGVAVLTPQLEELADYRVEARSIPTIEAAVRALRERLPGHPPVGLMGLSFAGGLALIAAADDASAPDVRWVMAVGAHDDLMRVMRFFATNQIQRPDGTTESLQAHDYGPLVVAYAHPEAFFPPEEVEPARAALRLWLAEDRDQARRALAPLSAGSRKKLEALFDRKVSAVAPELLAALPRFAVTAGAVSPHRWLSRIHAPVLLLHGAGDNVIPATETRWLAQGLPAGVPHQVLISEALQHVELQGEPTLQQKWALLHFVADLVDLAQGG